jgi:hypothetical protein
MAAATQACDLLLAETPPSSLDRYFYFEDVRDQDSLFRHVVRAILAIEPAAPIS